MSSLSLQYQQCRLTCNPTEECSLTTSLNQAAEKIVEFSFRNTRTVQRPRQITFKLLRQFSLCLYPPRITKQYNVRQIFPVNILRQGPTDVPKIYEISQNSKRQKHRTKAVPHEGLANIWRHRTKFSVPGCMHPRLKGLTEL
jgi:hypothetical protein